MRGTRTAVVILLSVSCFLSFAQTNTGNKQSFTADFDLFKNILEKAHAGLYKYHSKQQMDSLFSHYRGLIGNRTGLIPFYQYLSSILAYTGSLHDDISLPDSTEKKLLASKGFFPYPVKMVDGKLLINTDSGRIPAGSAIISINDQTTQDILPQLYKYYTTDGFNITGKAQGINSQFPLFYRLEYGQQNQFAVVYKPVDKVDPVTVILQPVAWKDYAALYASRHSAIPDTTGSRTYSCTIIDSLRTAILTIRSFSLGSGSSARHKAYRDFLRSNFAAFKEKGIENLVVDIRKNGGGSDPNDLLTFSYLARKPFKENEEAFTLFQTVPYKEFCTDDSTDIADIEENFRDEHNQLRDGRYYQNPDYNRFWQPDSLAFSGKIYLLVGPAVASAASLFASMVKSEGSATVVGEETMGGYYGHTGHNSLSYQLPHSGISFSISLVDLKQYVTPKKEIPFGSGILPDIRIGQSLEDFMTNRDTVLNSVLEMIRKKTVPSRK